MHFLLNTSFSNSSLILNFKHSFQTCYYCKLKGASIGCDKRSCRKSFHLNCGIENNCLTEFYGKYRSFCHLHVPFERSTIHIETEKCILCLKDMGKFHPVSSVELPCCDTKWYHSKCLKHMVNKQTTPRCQHCGDEDDFQKFLLSNGIFVQDWYVLRAFIFYISFNFTALCVTMYKLTEKAFILYNNNH